jgi:hypothetical protein
LTFFWPCFIAQNFPSITKFAGNREFTVDLSGFI